MSFAKAGRIAMVCGLLACLAAAIVPASAQQPLKKVRIVVGGTSLLNITYPWLNLPVALNYWKDEGYDVEVAALAPPVQVMPLLIAGSADFIQTSGSVVIQANAMQNQQVRVAMQNTILDWALGVPEGSAIKSLNDLKGKSIGVLSLATGSIHYLKSYLRQSGMAETDVTLIPVGAGAPAMDALKQDRVQAIMLWAAGFANIENAGMKLRYLRGSDWRTYPDYSLAVLQKTVDSDPKMVEAIIRGAAKATLFSMTNPDCVRQIQWTKFPNTKPSGADEETLKKWDLNNLAAELDGMRDSHVLNGNRYYGETKAEGFGRLQTFLQETKQIDKVLPAESYLVNIPDFYAKANNFDMAAVKTAAEQCKMP